MSAPISSAPRERQPSGYIEPVLPTEPTNAQTVSLERDLFAPSRPGAGLDPAPAPNRDADARESVAAADATADAPPRETAPVPDTPVQTAPEPPPASASAAAPDRQDSRTDAPERVVVGTYASGGNTYAMFADGSIEAETPRGRFTFGSLKELKAFVDAGGENNARGAA